VASALTFPDLLRDASKVLTAPKVEMINPETALRCSCNGEPTAQSSDSALTSSSASSSSASTSTVLRFLALAVGFLGAVLPLFFLGVFGVSSASGEALVLLGMTMSYFAGRREKRFALEHCQSLDVRLQSRVMDLRSTLGRQVELVGDLLPVRLRKS